MSNVKCNWCELVTDEDSLIVRDDEEYCPGCGRKGYIADFGEGDAE